MRKPVLVASLAAVLLVAGCEEQAPTYVISTDPADIRECEVLFAVAKQYYRYGGATTAPRMRAPHRREITKCDWAGAGLTFAERTPESRFDWVQFDRPVFGPVGAEVRTMRSESNDFVIMHECHLNSWQGAWYLGKCRDISVAPQQGLE